MSSEWLRQVEQGTERWLAHWMVADPSFIEHHNQCMANASAAEWRLRSLTGTYGVVQSYERAVQIACYQTGMLYGSELWWDPKGGSRREDLQLVLTGHARPTLSPLPTSRKGVLMRNSVLTPAVVALYAR